MVGDRALIKYRLTMPGCAPTQAYSGDAGWDLYVAERTILHPFVTKDVSCGFDIALPDGYWARIDARSSTIRRHRVLVGGAVIDAGYRGPMFVCLTSLSYKPIIIEAGWRLAQIILHRVEPVRWECVSTLPPSARGQRAFGSSGI